MPHPAILTFTVAVVIKRVEVTARVAVLGDLADWVISHTQLEVFVRTEPSLRVRLRGVFPHPLYCPGGRLPHCKRHTTVTLTDSWVYTEPNTKSTVVGLDEIWFFLSGRNTFSCFILGHFQAGLRANFNNYKLKWQGWKIVRLFTFESWRKSSNIGLIK